MDRRKFIGMMAGASTIGIAGCSDSSEQPTSAPTEKTNSPTETDTPTSTPTDTPTETETATEEPDPANFEVVSYDFPETLEINKEASVSITIRNTGDKSGTFSEPIYYRVGDGDWQEGSYWESEVDGGETVTMESDGKISYVLVSSVEFRLGHSDKTTTIQFVSADLNWGESFTTPDGYSLTMGKPDLVDSYRYEDYDGSIERKQPDGDGKQFAFLPVTAVNNSGQVEDSPYSGDMAIIAGNSQYDAEYLYEDPIDYGEEYESGELQPEIKRDGWVVFIIDASITMSEVEAVWSESYYQGTSSAKWSQ